MIRRSGEGPQLMTGSAVGEEAEQSGQVIIREVGKLSAPIDRMGAAVEPGSTAKVDVVVRTRKIGHFFPGGTLDSFDIWLELQAKDAEGKVTKTIDLTPPWRRIKYKDLVRERAGSDWFDLSPPGAELPEADLTTAKLGTPVQPPVRFLSTGHEAFIVQADVGYQLTADQVAPLRLQSGKGTGFSGVDLRGWAIDASSQPATTTPAGEVVDRVTGRVDPVAALNGIVALASQLGGGPDSALSIAASDADRVHAATQASSLELLVGRDDHVLRALTARVEFAAPQTQSTGGAVVQALSKFGHLTLTIELRIDHPNDQVTITRPARVRPIAEFPRS